jgi:tRNA threonylcarbamoyladenosine biosynthesis protein TsaE
MTIRMKNIFITNNSTQTRELGEMLAGELRGGEIVCLTGELGSGKTTFAQGLLKGLGAKGPYTSPTFVVMKHYKRKAQSAKRKIVALNSKPENVYHIDAYRVNAQDILDLGWEEMVSDKKNIIIVEWAERIKSIVPDYAIWIKFNYSDEHTRKIEANSKFKNQNAK